MVVGEDQTYQDTSVRYVGKWNLLVSTTNWEKGRIIRQWRDELIADSAPAAEYSDEAWSRRVGGVSPQHVGRLRRVSERFDAESQQYEGLFWSHFHASLDWEDAEMWLEGAVQSGWSVSQMKNQRWEAIGAPAELRPRDEDIISSELDEDAESDETAVGTIRPTVEEVLDPADDGAAVEADDDSAAADTRDGVASHSAPTAQLPDAAASVRPFEDLPAFPDDLAEALESFKLAILRHKLAGWQDAARSDVLAALDALKTLAVTPTGDA